MITIGPSGFGQAPLDVAPGELPADQFRQGDLWQNSRGTRHRVLYVRDRVAHMVNQQTGRTHSRAWDDIGIHSGRPWVRIELGESA